MLLYHEKNNTKREVLQFLFFQNFYDRIICGFKISSYLFAGGILAWFVLIPAIVVFGGESVLFPCDISINELYTAGGAGDMSQDLKTGYILGATPKKQQIDGKRSVKEIADLLKKSSGTKLSLCIRVFHYI